MTTTYYVSKRALESIERECRRYPDAETGGILVGFRYDTASDTVPKVIITHATGPGPNSQRSTAHFVKDTQYLQTELEVLFLYHQVNYLGVWHKHPSDFPSPSSGDVVSAMEELHGGTVGLQELITPIAILKSGIVEIRPHVISYGHANEIAWLPVSHDELPDGRSVSTQWHTTQPGQDRLESELDSFKNSGIEVEVRQGADGGYRLRAPLVDGSSRVLVFLCHADYPVAAPDMALYEPATHRFEQVHSEIIDRWDIDRTMAEAYEGLWSIIQT